MRELTLKETQNINGGSIAIAIGFIVGLIYGATIDFF